MSSTPAASKLGTFCTIALLTIVLLPPNVFSPLATFRMLATTDAFGSAVSHLRSRRPVWPVTPATTTVGDEDVDGEEELAALAARDLMFKIKRLD